MEKRLFLIRHGKANHPAQGASDFTRTLAESGETDVRRMAEKLKNMDIVPDILVSSPAARALSTATGFAEVWKSPVAIRTEPSIYEAEVRNLLKVVNNLNNRYPSAAIFGHNPGITELANYLSNVNIPNIPTAGVVVIEFPMDDWKYLTYESGTILLFDFPKTQISALGRSRTMS
jgi:phosphohistidine phosphatase